MKNLKTRATLVFFLVSTLLFEGCAPMPFKRDFKRMFSPYLSRIDDNPIIIIPGIIGSRLIDTKTGKILWGSLRLKQVFFLSEREDIALPIAELPLEKNRDTITSKGIIDKYEMPIEIIQFTVYRELLDMFENVGYKFGDIRNPKAGDNLYIFDYDWRRDNVENVKILAARIENIKKTTGRPKEKFTLICHSMGGLIGRYYMRYGGEDVLGQEPNFRVTCKGAKNIKRLILIGVPNLGSMPIFRFLHEGLNLTVIDYPSYVLFTMPSVYQLLPPRHIASFIDGEGNDMAVDFYDVKNWKKFGWSIYSEKTVTHTKSRHKLRYKDSWEEEFRKFEAKRDRFVGAALERADRFQKSLLFNPRKRSPCEVILFGGDMEWTLNKALLKKDNNGKWRTYFWDQRLEEEMFIPGDSMVTRESLLGKPTASITRRGWQDSPIDISFSLFVTQRHENIHKDITFQNNLLHLLLGEQE